MTPIFESFRVVYRRAIMLETLDFGEAMKIAREQSNKAKHVVIVQICTSDYYTTRGFWQSGVWFE